MSRRRSPKRKRIKYGDIESLIISILQRYPLGRREITEKIGSLKEVKAASISRALKTLHTKNAVVYEKGKFVANIQETRTPTVYSSENLELYPEQQNPHSQKQLELLDIPFLGKKQCERGAWIINRRGKEGILLATAFCIETMMKDPKRQEIMRADWGIHSSKSQTLAKQMAEHVCYDEIGYDIAEMILHPIPGYEQVFIAGTCLRAKPLMDLFARGACDAYVTCYTYFSEEMMAMRNITSRSEVLSRLQNIYDKSQLLKKSEKGTFCSVFRKLIYYIEDDQQTVPNYFIE